MKKAIVLFTGLICVVLFGFSAEAGLSGDGVQRPSGPTRTVVAREWKGRVASARADDYHSYLLGGVAKLRSTRGCLGVQVMRRDEAGAVGFTVISYWESREAIKAYAGQDIEKPHHLPKDRELLLELPTRVLHYDVTYTDLALVRVGQ
ncbi:MAG TPA: antibiotic biosynthesis monooxygenase family protein [Pyrinomonadaceae bacterium]|nr:antibiotic biosynthesis monooxygenase family protein [Pyrinomonadaceae bacterium]